MQTLKTGSLLLTLGTSLLLGACGQDVPQPNQVASRSQADFVNGDFESGDLTGWTVTTAQNKNITIPPMSEADLRLQAGGTMATFVRMADPPESAIPARLAATDSLRYPRFGKYCTVVNENITNYNVNRMTQDLVTTSKDVDVYDGKIHVRFALAPVLENPLHDATQQPYFYFELRNVTKNTVLSSLFNYANQPGVPWKTSGTNIQYTDWQIYDVAPGPTGIAIGDTLRMVVIAAGCGAGGHFGQLLLDGFGSYLPGLAIAGSGPQSANAGSNITYTFNATNGGTGPANDVVVIENIPDGATFVSTNGQNCTTPPVGMKGAVTCQLGTLNAGGASSFQVTVKIDATAPGGSFINNGNYTIGGMGVSPIIGPLITTAVTTGVVYTDLAVTVTDGAAATPWDAPITYTVVVTNNGPSAVTGAKLANSVPAELTGVTWTCAGNNGGVCGATSGTDALNATADLPVGASATYTVKGKIIPGTLKGIISYLVSVATPMGVTDGTTNNNQAVDTNNIGTILQLSVNKGESTGTGAIISSPASIKCEAACKDQAGGFLSGDSITLTAIADEGSTFTGWGGACADQGTSRQCTITLLQAQTVTAQFMLPSFTITVNVPGGGGTITCPSPVVQGRDAACTVTPDAGYTLATLTLDDADIFGTASGNGFSVTNVQGNRVVEGTFKKGAGTACTDQSECGTGFCVGGVCCNTECTSGCQVCNAPGQAGTCTAACGNYACNEAADSCYASCTTSAECQTGGNCVNGACMAPANYTLAGGGFGCEFGGLQASSAAGQLGFLAALGLLLRRRRARNTGETATA